MKKISKILAANRSEIAIRIFRAAEESGISTAAIYSKEDRFALHRFKTDESYLVGVGKGPIQAYLDINSIIDIAKKARVDAIHPGYGFLSENPDLASICKRRGIKFIGPDHTVISMMGDKVKARKAMIEAAVPVIPGSDGNIKDIEEALKIANSIGYPIMLKATNGGGGRGIRRCDNEKELLSNYDRVISEATKAFGSPELFIEKCVVTPKHIEVQVLADQKENVIHLFERDCSIQRRNQKLIEIAPSPQLSNDQRNYIGNLAVKAAKAVKYVNAGTVEFLLDSDDNFYFMEMNTRLQVEHTITETITGIDIVQEQIRIASGMALRYSQEEVNFRGYAIEFRINAEDPKQDFLPSFGKITRYFAAGGPGVRTDASVYTGYIIPPYYDSMCAKLTVWALNWDDAIQRGSRALDDIGLFGVKTTIPYYKEILKNELFVDANFNTSFVESHPELVDYEEEMSPDIIAAAIASAIAAHEGI